MRKQSERLHQARRQKSELPLKAQQRSFRPAGKGAKTPHRGNLLQKCLISDNIPTLQLFSNTNHHMAQGASTFLDRNIFQHTPRRDQTTSISLIIGMRIYAALHWYNGVTRTG